MIPPTKKDSTTSWSDLIPKSPRKPNKGNKSKFAHEKSKFNPDNSA
jgi:hypothetical protein